MIKWKLMLTTLPMVALVVLLKLVMERVFGLPGWVEFSDVGPVLAAGAFLIGFMAAGKRPTTRRARSFRRSS